PTSDMTARGHAMHLLREVPQTIACIGRALLSLAFTTAGIVWLYPRGVALAIAGAVVAAVVPHLLRRPLLESSMRLRAQAASLERFYLDALLGVVPVRVHGAERAVRREHEQLLAEWTRTGRALHRQSTLLAAAQSFTGTLVAVGIVGAYCVGRGDPATVF